MGCIVYYGMYYIGDLHLPAYCVCVFNQNVMFVLELVVLHAVTQTSQRVCVLAVGMS